MPKNILIFSDGTGQAGGLRPDENRSNIYKLYRATRCGPDTTIDPREQLAFYDAGLGSRPPGGALFVTRAYRWLHNVVSQATGLGITTNIIDCYAAIIRMWEPGDRIFLFGFSRGAYTVRCLAAVLGQCGVPTTMADGPPRRVCSAVPSHRRGSCSTHSPTSRQEARPARSGQILISLPSDGLVVASGLIDNGAGIATADAAAPRTPKRTIGRGRCAIRESVRLRPTRSPSLARGCFGSSAKADG